MRVMTANVGALDRAAAADLHLGAVMKHPAPVANGPPGKAAAAPCAWRWSHAVPAVMVAVSILAQCSPTIQAILQFDRSAIAAGQLWRLFTGNLVHYNWTHWAANVGTFAALYWVAAGGGRRLLGTVLLSALAVGAGVYVCAGDVATYRGISGVDCALAARVLVMLAIRDGRRHGAAWLTVLLVVMAKSVYEMVTDQVLLPTSAPEGVSVVGITHVIGLAIGSAHAALTRSRPAAPPPSALPARAATANPSIPG